MIYNNKTHKQKGYCYVEFSDEVAVDKVLEEEDSIFIDDKKVNVKRSQSIVKLREGLKYVAHVSNLNFKAKEKDIKEFFSSNGIAEDSILEILLIKDDQQKPKGFGFVEFDSQENLEKAIGLSGKLIKNRPVVIKISKRNITSKKKEAKIEGGKKRKREDSDNLHDVELNSTKKAKMG